MKRSLFVIVALVSAAGVAACGSDVVVPPAATPTVTVELGDTRYEDAVVATNALGGDLLVAGDPNENTIISPASLAIALAMLAEGTIGDAVAEVDGLLGLSSTERTEAYSALSRELGEYQSGVFSIEDVPESPYLRVANNLTVMEGFEVKETFSTSLEAYFGAPLGYADLSSSAGKKVLDAWVKENTAGLIKESAIEPSQDLRLVLQNALLFAAKWAEVFDPNSTFEGDFTRGDGTVVQTDLMNATMNVAYAEAGGYAAIALPYSEDFTAYLVLPPAGEFATADGTRAAIDAIRATGAGDLVTLQIPTFDLVAQTDVMAYLQEIGIRAIFEDEGSLGGISDAGLVVSAIAQQARLIVDEEGTVGAAVTEIAVDESAAPMPTHEFRADRPFVMTVRHDATGIDVFTAAINDPTLD